MKKVCFISLSAYGYFFNSEPFGGGAERQSYLLSKYLTEDFDISIIVGDYGQEDQELEEGVTLHKAYPPSHSSSFFNQINKVFSLRRAMQETGADVFIYRGNPRTAAIIYILSESLKTPWIYHISNDSNVTDDFINLAYPFKLVFCQAIQNASRVIAQTEYQANKIKSEFNREICIIPNGYPMEVKPLPLDQRKYFLWVGRLDEEQKRPHYYISIAESYPDEEFVLVAKPGNDTVYNKSIIQQAELVPNVSYAENVGPDDVHSYYRNAIALINTSKYEGFPNTFLEAWRYQTPVLTLSINLDRFIPVGTAGFAQDDFDLLVDLCQLLSEDKSLHRKLGKDSCLMARRKYSMEVIRNEYKFLLNDVLGHNSN